MQVIAAGEVRRCSETRGGHGLGVDRSELGERPALLLLLLVTRMRMLVVLKAGEMLCELRPVL